MTQDVAFDSTSLLSKVRWTLTASAPEPDLLFNRLLDRFFIKRSFVCRAIRGGGRPRSRSAFIMDARGNVGLLEVSTIGDAVSGERRHLGWLDDIGPSATAACIESKQLEMVTISTWIEALRLIEDSSVKTDDGRRAYRGI